MAVGELLPVLEAALKILPKIRGPIQLAGLAFTVFSAVLIYRLDPGNVGSLSIAGAIGIALIAIPLAFHSNVLQLIPKAQRVWFLLVLTTLLLVSFSALAYLTAHVIWSPTPKGARFDSSVDTKTLRFLKLSDAKSRVELVFDLFPLTTNSSEGATVFAGIVVLHDEEKIERGGVGNITENSCAKTSSCVGSYVFSEFVDRPVFVRGGAPIVPLRVAVDFRGSPKFLRVWWEFYQREGGDGFRCGVDHDRRGPEDGIPPLAMFDSQNTKVSSICHNSTDHVVIPVVY